MSGANRLGNVAVVGGARGHAWIDAEHVRPPDHPGAVPLPRPASIEATHRPPGVYDDTVSVETGPGFPSHALLPVVRDTEAV